MPAIAHRVNHPQFSLQSCSYTRKARERTSTHRLRDGDAATMIKIPLSLSSLLLFRSRVVIWRIKHDSVVIYMCVMLYVRSRTREEGIAMKKEYLQAGVAG